MFSKDHLRALEKGLCQVFETQASGDMAYITSKQTIKISLFKKDKQFYETANPISSRTRTHYTRMNDEENFIVLICLQ